MYNKSMTKKDKFKIVILTIFTLGFCWLHWYRINKKHQNLVQGKIDADINQREIDELIRFIGGLDNINDVSSSGSKLKIFFKNSQLIDSKSIIDNKLATGVFVSSDSITLIVGVKSSAYVNALKK
ncbi:hypothetical protein MBVG596_0157 [Mycoplasmopsis bovigenitalium]|nr:hypothetical protein MBVG596_0157 [Mycoplasmopsis bovigenitalium]